MLAHSLKCKKDTDNVDSKVLKTINSRAMRLSKCPVCGSKKSRFMKKQETKGLLSSVGLKTPSSNIPLLGKIFF